MDNRISSPVITNKFLIRLLRHRMAERGLPIDAASDEEVASAAITFRLAVEAA